jgi:5-methylcytosine-specific restriction protein A
MASSEYYSDDELINAIEKSNIFDNVQTFEYTGKPNQRKCNRSKKIISYPRSKGVSQNALNKAGYRCKKSIVTTQHSEGEIHP